MIQLNPGVNFKRGLQCSWIHYSWRRYWDTSSIDIRSGGSLSAGTIALTTDVASSTINPSTISISSPLTATNSITITADAGASGTGTVAISSPLTATTSLTILCSWHYFCYYSMARQTSWAHPFWMLDRFLVVLAVLRSRVLVSER